MRHEREADVFARGALTRGPGDEPLEPFNGRRRRRNEPRHFLGREHREQRRRVRRAKLAERQALAAEQRQPAAPIGLDDGRYWRDHGL